MKICIYGKMKKDKKESSEMAAACPVKRHLRRGFAGLGLLVAAAVAYGYSIWLSLAFVAVAAFFLRGCPVCWSFWLYEALRDKKRAAQTPPDPPA